jgi:3-oxoadipate enol-lactonase
VIELGYFSPLPLDQLQGSQKALLLGPSLGSTHRAWDRALSFIGEDIKPIVFDLPGHGLTPTPDSDWSISDLADAVVRLADRLEIRQFSYAGISLSGAVGYQLALSHERRLSSVGVLCSAPKLGSAEAWQKRIEQVENHGTSSLVEATMQRWFTPRFAERKPEVVSQFAEDLAAVDDLGYIQACRALAEFDVWDRLAQIELPTLIVHGSEDQVVSWEDAQRADSLIADSGLIEISGVSHQAIAEAPEVAIKHISFYARKFR